ncbi:PilZ domain-containing protein [Desulfobacter sp.]
MTGNFSKDNALLDEIISAVRFLTEERQKDVLTYIRNIKEPVSYPDVMASIQNNTEPRSYPRVKISVEIDALIGEKVIQSNAKNLSASGVFIKSRMSPDIGVPAKIVFSLPGRTQPFKLTGTVARITPDGIGICFSEMPSCARDLLDNLLKRVSSGFRS